MYLCSCALLLITYDACFALDLTPPVVVLNNFGQAEENHLKLMKLTFQHMFPTINVKTVQLSQVRRVVLFHYHKESDTVEMRHYAIRANPVGISKSVKRIVQAKIPNLGRLKDIADYLEDGDYGASDSEVEDDSSKVTLPERYAGRGNIKSQVSALKLIEIGPRLSLELYKVQQGVNEGDILYHKFVHKTAEEAAAIKQRVEKERLLKEMRKKQQQENVDKKKKEKEEKQQRKKQKKEEKAHDEAKKDEESEEDEESEDEDDDDDDDDEEEEDEDEVKFEEDDGEGEYDEQDDEADEEGEGEDEEEEN
ncbi:hypothetical protein EON65_17465 [archaeon]|nr:MAG: hypothetical protein EON65_17465 [archaeon]